jgi:hypothetical protein
MMFLRWQGRKRQTPDSGSYGDWLKDEQGTEVRNKRASFLRVRHETGKQDICWAAILVESIRINGKPRQRHIAYLGSITDSRIEVVHQRRYFWDNVLDGLDRQANRMSIADRKRIEAAIALKVPRLTRQEHEDSVRVCVWSHDHPPYRPPLE